MLSTRDFTLVIPTYNRPALLHGLLAHLRATRALFPIIVLDSSKEESRLVNRRTVASSSLRVQLAEFQQTIPVIEKLISGLEGVKTRYVALCADDDLVFVDTIEASLEELEASNDHVACHGTYLNFSPQGRTINVHIEYSAPSLDGETPIERIFQQLSRYEALNYAVYRRECLVNAVSTSTNVRTPMFWELFSGTVPLLSGKVKRLGRVSNARRARVGKMGIDWHPVSWICEDPDQFFTEFANYRREFLKVAERMRVHAPDFATKFTRAHIPYVLKELRSARTVMDDVAAIVLPLERAARGGSGTNRPPFLSRVRQLYDRALARSAMVDVPVRDAGTVVRLRRSDRSHLTPGILGDLSRYWSAVLDMDPAGPA